ncbi:MAG: hypothetical protein EB090_02535 [Verrucomicrobia bacterium]|nr:hypothetical protein [Verrucomicrobiota bacterium]
MRRKPLPHVVERAINLRARARDVFDFHLHPKNLTRVNPAGLRILSLRAPEKIQEGSELHLRVSSWGIPQKWDVVVREIRNFEGQPAKAAILDEAVRGPFPFWRHLHEFWQAPDGSTGLADRVEFLPPGGVVGIVLVPFIKFMLGKMFEARHEATRRFLEKR